MGNMLDITPDDELDNVWTSPFVVIGSQAQQSEAPEDAPGRASGALSVRIVRGLPVDVKKWNDAHNQHYRPARSIQYNKVVSKVAAGITTTHGFNFSSCGRVTVPKSPLLRIDLCSLG